MFNRLLPSRILCLHTATVLLFAGSVGSQSPCPAGETFVRTGPSGPVCARQSRPPPCVGGQRRVGRRCECPASHPNFDSSRQLCIWPCEANAQWNADSNECVSNTPAPPPAPPPPPTPTADDARQWLADQIEQSSGYEHSDCRRVFDSPDICRAATDGQGSSFRHSRRYRRPTFQQCSFSFTDQASTRLVHASRVTDDFVLNREDLILVSGTWNVLDVSSLHVRTDGGTSPTLYYVNANLLPGRSIVEISTWNQWNNRYAPASNRAEQTLTRLSIRFLSEDIARRAIPAIQLLIRSCTNASAF